MQNYNGVQAEEKTLRQSFRNEKIVSRISVYDFFKRGIDIILSLIACIIAIPISLIACICVVIESKGSPIFTQDRLGKDGRVFKIYKIRSMCTDAEKVCGPKWADKNDCRVTKVGKFIRMTRIDELPQIFNILIGNMSIVGPRPERPELAAKFERQISGFSKRLSIKPGLTGLAQINGGYDITAKEKLKYDLEYIRKRNIWMDLVIIIKTVIVVVTGNGAR
jgi:lipopolysaccharide/colanic/teichoic acid biosynthesis glycosyltransferase